jgi:putative membrane protein
MKLKVCSVLIGAAVLCVPSMMLAQSGSGSSTTGTSSKRAQSVHTDVTAADKKFVRDAAEGGLAEVELGKLATEKASSEEVKKFGQRMQDDHSKANDELKQLASSKGISVAEELSAKDKALKDRLSNLSGAQFDKVYMNNMVSDHKKDVAEFAKESKSGNDSDVKQFAEKTLPTLKDHLKEAEGIAPSKKAASTAKASSTGASE